MGEQGATAGVATGYIEAFGRGDLAAIRGYLADDVVFESPRVAVRGADEVAAAVAEFAGVVTGVTIIAAVGDERQAMIIYDMATRPFGTIRAVDHLVVEDGQITSDTLVFDTSPLRS